MTPPARTLWRFVHRDGSHYVFVLLGAGSLRRVPVERFWGGAR